MKNNNRPSLMSRHYKTPRSKVARSAYVCFVISRLILGDPGADKGGEGNMERRKVKNGEKSPWRHCLTRLVPNGRRLSGFWLVPEKHKFSGTNQKPERRRPFGTGAVRHCPQRLFSPFFTFLRATFSRPFRLSLAPTICPWVSEDVPGFDLECAFTYPRRLHARVKSLLLYGSTVTQHPSTASGPFSCSSSLLRLS